MNVVHTFAYDVGLAAKPDSGEPNNVSCWRSTRGEDTMRKHGAEVPNAEQAFGERMAGGEDTSVSWCRSTRHPERMAGEISFRGYRPKK